MAALEADTCTCKEELLWLEVYVFTLNTGTSFWEEA